MTSSGWAPLLPFPFLDPTLTPGFALYVSYLLEGSFYPHEDFYYSPLTFQLFSNKGYFTYSILTIFEDRGHTKFFPITQQVLGYQQINVQIREYMLVLSVGCRDARQHGSTDGPGTY